MRRTKAMLSICGENLRKSFLFKKTYVSLCISFQKFQEAWNEYVEIDEDEEVDNMDKIKVVVLPILGTPQSLEEVR